MVVHRFAKLQPNTSENWIAMVWKVGNLNHLSRKLENVMKGREASISIVQKQHLKSQCAVCPAMSTLPCAEICSPCSLSSQSSASLGSSVTNPASSSGGASTPAWSQEQCCTLMLFNAPTLRGMQSPSQWLDSRPLPQANPQGQVPRPLEGLQRSHICWHQTVGPAQS